MSENVSAKVELESTSESTCMRYLFQVVLST